MTKTLIMVNQGLSTATTESGLMDLGVAQAYSAGLSVSGLSQGPEIYFTPTGSLAAHQTAEIVIQTSAGMFSEFNVAADEQQLALAPITEQEWLNTPNYVWMKNGLGEISDGVSVACLVAQAPVIEHLDKAIGLHVGQQQGGTVTILGFEADKWSEVWDAEIVESLMSKPNLASGYAGDAALMSKIQANIGLG